MQERCERMCKSEGLCVRVTATTLVQDDTCLVGTKMYGLKNRSSRAKQGSQASKVAADGLAF